MSESDTVLYTVEANYSLRTLMLVLYSIIGCPKY